MPPRSMQSRLTLLEQRVSQLETAAIPAFREEMRAGFDAVDRRFEALEQRMEQGFEETRRHARVLYEDLVSRIATIGEGGPAPTRRAAPQALTRPFAFCSRP